MTLSLHLARSGAALALAICLSAGPAPAQNAAPDAAPAEALPDLGGREVVVAMENAYPPLQFIEMTGSAVGWEYDALAEIGRRLNLEVEFVNSSWDAMIPGVAEGQFDLAANGITITEDRAREVAFSAPYMRSEMVMLVRGDESRFSDAAGFAANADLLVAAQPGTTPFYVAVHELLSGNETSPRLRLFETFGAGVAALRADDVDLVLTDSTAGAGYVAASDGGLKLVGAPLGSEDFGFIFGKGSDLVAPFDAAIAQMRADGTLEALNRQWFLEYYGVDK